MSALGPIPENPSTPHRDLAGGRRIRGRGFAVFEQDPTLAVLTTPNDDVGAWIDAGQALERVLLAWQPWRDWFPPSRTNRSRHRSCGGWCASPDRPLGFLR